MDRKMIEVHRSGTRSVCRAVRDFVCRAARTLASPDLSDTEVHEARKDIERSRAALRLLRPALGESIYRRENTVLRDVSHSLNAARDAKVLMQTLQSLRRNHRALQRDAEVARLLRSLHADRAGLRRRLRDHGAQLAGARGALERLGNRVTQWGVGAHGWSVLGPALKRIYKSGRRALPDRPRPTNRALHQWRKKVKYLRYALEVLTPTRHRRLARLARQAGELTDSLGAAHDLAVLAAKARLYAKSKHADLRELLTIIEPQRERLSLQALSSGARLYHPKPDDWERPLQRHWIRWRRAD